MAAGADGHQRTLGEVFSANRMKAVWRHTVRTGLRSQAVLDLHDYHDFHRSHDALVDALRSEISSFTYRPKRTLPVRLEKAAGISRTVQIPAPEDALILQTIVEVLSPPIKQAQPTRNAFYSRSHGHVENPGALDNTFGYMWWDMWPKFQERILRFTQICPCLIVTDLADYFDSINLSLLRNTLSSIARFDQPVLDFLFYMLHEFASRPDYSLFSGIGLPQVNFDAPRLLGHAFLFDSDAWLQHRSEGNFVRWMDDMNIGVESADVSRALVSELDQLLRARGLRLNVAKTKLLTGQQAAFHFAFAENQFLTLVHNSVNFDFIPSVLSNLPHSMKGDRRAKG